ncbi:MAG: TetR/AcrR family transcriptional regulator [Anaerolineales bacterium]|jgi:AcrR family transcriptional regulator
MTLENILTAAALIFQEKGYHAASMQDIADAVDLKKGSLYHYVDSKQDILYALLDEALSMILERLQTVISRDQTPQQKIRQAMRAYLSFLAENPSLSSVLLLEYRSLEPVYKKKHIPLRDQVDQIWESILKEGNELGEFTAPEPGLISKALLGVLNWTITWYKEDGPLSAEQIADQFTDLFLAGLLSSDHKIQ